MLSENWYVPGSIKSTVENIVAAGDPTFVRQLASVVEFERRLIDEVGMLGVFPADEERRIENYIHTHREELFDYARRTLLSESRAR